MLLFLTILGFGLALIALALTIYLVFCALFSNKFLNQNGKLTDDNVKNIVKLRSKFNFPLNITLKLSEKALNKQSSGGAKLVKAIVGKMKAICFSAAGTLLTGALYAFAFGVAMYSLNMAATTAAMVTSTLLGGDTGCTCYVQCSGDSSQDKKSTYELLFGGDAYKEFIKNAKLTDENKTKLNDCKTGKEKNDILSAFINDYMITQYRENLSTRDKFRKKDGLNREGMSNEELGDDLVRLLADYKVNGKNPTCECSKLSGMSLDMYCMGGKEYRKKWTFTDNGGPITSGGDQSDTGDTIAGSGSVGHATGSYTIQLLDGLTYYWYHQSAKCGCDHDVIKDPYGRLSLIECGSGKGTMADRGCSMYSTAMALSCVLDTEITPYTVITDVLKADLTRKADGTYNFVTSSRGISNTGAMSMDKKILANSIMEVYGSQGVVAKEIGPNQNEVDEILEKGGLVIFSFKGSDDNWSWYPGDGHFMVIRKKEDGLYYKLDSTANIHNPTRPRDNMNLGLPWNEVKAHMKHTGLAIWREGGPDNGGNTGGGGGDRPVGNLEVYNKLAADPRYSSKATAMALAYTYAVDKYGENFAIGLMANILAEGDSGLVEGMWTYSSGGDSKVKSNCSCNGSSGKYVYWYWNQASCAVHSLAYTYIDSESDIDTLLTIPNGVAGIGVGSVQWSGGRRVGLLNLYKQKGVTFSKDELLEIEVEYTMMEFAGDYYKVVMACSGKSAAECGSIICSQYEKPAGSDQPVIRGNSAAEIYALLHN